MAPPEGEVVATINNVRAIPAPPSLCKSETYELWKTENDLWILVNVLKMLVELLYSHYQKIVNLARRLSPVC